jgi:predicted dehydrogenase
VLGEVRQAHVWFDGGNGPQTRPADAPPVPSTLDWDLWLGPAESRAYHPAYLPGSWRAWRAFGSGIVGDFGCHTGNIMFRALKLEQLWVPGAVPPAEATIRFQAWPSEADVEGYPRSMRAVFDFPAREGMPPVQVTFYAQERPGEAVMLGYPQAGWGDLIVGSRGSLYSDCPWNTRYVLLPEDQFEGFKGGPPETLPRSPGHHLEWVEACKGRGKTFSSFEIGGPLTEVLQLANLATLEPGPLEYNPQQGRILNSSRADARLHRAYRTGWEL